MKKEITILNNIAKAIIIITALLLTLFGCVKISPVCGLLGIALIFIGLCLDDKNGWTDLCGLVGIICYIFSLISIALFWKIRVNQRPNQGVEIVRGFNSFWGESLDEGIGVDTLEFNSKYGEYFGRYKVEKEQFYYLKRADSTFTIFKDYFGFYNVICEGTGHPLFLKRDFGYGELDVIKFQTPKKLEWKIVDMMGEDINAEDYTPPVIENTPEVNPYPA